MTTNDLRGHEPTEQAPDTGERRLPRPGDVVAKRYRIDAGLGRGGSERCSARRIAWCKQGDDHQAKFCAMVKSVEVAEDKTVESPYPVNQGPAVTTYIATKLPKQIMNHGDAWVETFLQTAKMPARSAD